MRANLLIKGAREVLTCKGPAPRRGPHQADAGALSRASVAALDGVIVFVGPATEAARVVTLTPDAVVIEADDCSVVPGFVDPHTHLVYAGDRRNELRGRLAGATYAEIAAAGGGIVATVDATRQASETQLCATSRVRLDEMLRCGTTTCEVKSGYGLRLEDELKMLRAIGRLAAEQPIEISATFMGAHEIPREYRASRGEYLAALTRDMLPRVAADRLADWCDVFCEQGVFTVEEARTILQAARHHGLGLRIHADELGSTGGARLAAELCVRSADHLVFVSREDARAMAAAGVTATLLPAAAFYLKLGRFAPARMLIDEGVAVALATDVNPGGGFSPSMPFVVTLACFGMGMTFEEALVGATINAAQALDRADRVGSLETGKQLDAVLVEGDPIELVRVGVPAIRHVIKRGRIVAPRSSPLAAGAHTI